MQKSFHGKGVQSLTLSKQAYSIQGHQKLAPETIEFPLSKTKSNGQKNSENLSRKWQLMTIMQPWEKACHRSRTYSLSNTLTYFLLICRKIWLKTVESYANRIDFLITYSGGNFLCPLCAGGGGRFFPVFQSSRREWLTQKCVDINVLTNLLIWDPL